MRNSLAITTWPIFEPYHSRKQELIEMIRGEDGVLDRLRDSAQDVYGYEYDETEEMKPEAIAEMVLEISDPSTIHKREDLSTMCLCDVNGAMFRVAVAAEFIGPQGLVGDSNTSEQYADMQFLNGSDRLFELCEYYSKVDCKEMA